MRHSIAHLSFDFLFFFLYGPALLWNFYLSRFQNWGLCVDKLSEYNLQLLCGVFCLITHKTAEVLWFTPWTLYQMWYIEKPHGLSEPTVCSFICMRLSMIVEFLLLVVPVMTLIVKLTEWSGPYLVLVFLLSTGFVQLVIMWLYPKLIMPLFSTFEPLPDWANPIKRSIIDEAHAAGMTSEQVRMEESYQYDVHSNASASLG